jgi:hypothetical protein
MATHLVAFFPTITATMTEPGSESRSKSISKSRAPKPAPVSIDEYVQMASPRVREALIDHIQDVPGTVAGLARFQRRKAKREYPRGFNDGAGRWYPSPEENADNFINGLRCPSAAWPLSYYHSARTLKHCIALEGGAKACIPILRKAVRGRSLAEVMEMELTTSAKDLVRVHLDRAVLRQTSDPQTTNNQPNQTKHQPRMM